jgi:tetratricopeptide (TPR) repeat protein
VLAILGGVLITGGVLTVAGLWFAKKTRIDRNLQAGDDSFDKKEWKKALDSYKLVIDDDRENPQATKRTAECKQKIDEAAVDGEATARIARAAATTTPEEAVRLLTGDGVDKDLTDDQKQRVAARTDVLLAVAHARGRLAEDLKRRQRPTDAARELEEARKAIDQAAANSPTPPPEVALERLRLLERQRGRANDVNATLNEIVSADPDGWCGAYARGRLALDSKPPKLDEALTQLDAAVAKTQEKNLLPEGLYFRGKARLLASRLADAKADFTAAAEASPDDARPAIALAKLALDAPNGAAQASALVLQAAGRAAPDDPEVLALQGELLVLQQQYAVALPKLNDALRVDPTLVRARRARATAWAESNSGKAPPPEFAQDLDAAIQNFPDDAGLYKYRGWLRYANRDYAGALQDFDVFLKQHDDDDVRMKRALCEVEKKQFDEAIADCDVLLAKNPKSGRVLSTKAFILLKKQDYASAIEVFTEAFKFLQGQELADTYYFRGMAYFGARRYKDASDDFDAYLKANPKGRNADAAKHFHEESEKALGKEKEKSSP